MDLELCYAPPFGTAKDVVNMAGYVASNLLNGDFKKTNQRYKCFNGLIIFLTGLKQSSFFVFR